MKKDSKTWIVYKHTCKINNKSYIGITSQKPTNRFGKNGRGYIKKYQTYFKNAILKYGWNNFETSILNKDIKTLEEANSLEKYWIAYYHTWIGDKNCLGYNGTQGGDGVLGHNVSTQAKKIMSEKAKNRIWITNGIVNKHINKDLSIPLGYWEGKTISQEAKQNIKEAAKKYSYKQKGKIISEKQKQAISKANKGRKIPENSSPEKIKKLQEARKIKAQERGYWISDEQNNKRKESLKNNIWITNGLLSIMINKKEPLPEGFWKGQTETEKKKNSHLKQYKKVICLETGKIYNSVKEAAKELNINPCNIVACAKKYKNAKTAKGYHWEYIV